MLRLNILALLLHLYNLHAYLVQFFVGADLGLQKMNLALDQCFESAVKGVFGIEQPKQLAMVATVFLVQGLQISQRKLNLLYGSL